MTAIIINEPRFVGELSTEIILNEERKVRVKENFAFIDSSGFEWLTPKDSIVDGSSIPAFLWSVIGSPFVGLHRVASFPHDVYCQTKSQPHKRVHKMYFEACRLNGVSRIMSNVLYAGLKVGAPKW